MANKNIISIGLKIDQGTDGFANLTIDAGNFHELMKAIVQDVKEFSNHVDGFTALADNIDSAADTLSTLQEAMRELTDAHAAQTEAETQLSVNMRNTMNAREEDIQSIKALCAAQQELGVIGDEIQLAGAQVLATYLSEKQSLEALIPVMNDVLAQQNGLNATQENAAATAAMLGSVMNGETEALSNCGYKFDETQEKVLKFGTESQRAAVLVDVISSSVGGMNEALAQTDDGKQKQLENTIIDLKEELGGIAVQAMPILTIAANSVIAIGGIMKLAEGVRTAVTALAAFNLQQKAMAVYAAVSSSISKIAQAFRIYSAAAAGSAASTLAFQVALKGLLISTGIGAAIVALTTVISYFVGRSDEATESTNRLLDAEELAKQRAEQLEQARQQEASTLATNRAALEINIATLKEFNGTKEEEEKLVNEMNNTYGETMGYFSSVSDWYDALIANSEAYCEQLVLEARARLLANQLAQVEQDRYNLLYNSNGTPRKYSTKNKDGVSGTSDYDKFKSNLSQNNRDKQNLGNQMSSVIKKMGAIKMPVQGAKTRPTTAPAPTPTPTHKKQTKSQPTTVEKPTYKENAQSIKEMRDNISTLSEERQTVTNDDRLAEINNEIKKWQELIATRERYGVEQKTEGPVFKEDAATLKEMEENVASLRNDLQGCSDIGKAIDINKQIDEWTKKADALRNAGKTTEDTSSPKLNPQAKSIKEIEENVAALNNELQNCTDINTAAGLNEQIAYWNDLAESMRNAGTESVDAFDTFKNGYNSMKGIGDGVLSITEALEGNGTAWETLTSIIDGFIQIYEGVQSIVEIINMLTTATGFHSLVAKNDANSTKNQTQQTMEHTSATVADTLATTAQLPVDEAKAITGATKSGAELGFPQNIIAIAAGVAAVIAAIAMIGSFANGGIVGGNSPTGDKLLARVNSGEMILNKEQQSNLFSLLNNPLNVLGNRALITPFAQGGILSGPTLGLLGEYAGASHNPEVVAPLDKLRHLIEPAGQPVIVGGTLRAHGRDLVCVLANETRIASKSGQRTDIKL